MAAGSQLTKIKKGFEELAKVGLVDDDPAAIRVSGAQAAGVLPDRHRVPRRAPTTIRPVKPNTIAKSLAIGNPADGYFALDVVRSQRRRDRRR